MVGALNNCKKCPIAIAKASSFQGAAAFGGKRTSCHDSRNERVIAQNGAKGSSSSPSAAPLHSTGKSRGCDTNEARQGNSRLPRRTRHRAWLLDHSPYCQSFLVTLWGFCNFSRLYPFKVASVTFNTRSFRISWVASRFWYSTDWWFQLVNIL